MQIRPMVQSDAAAVARIHVASWHQTYQNLLPASVIEQHSYDQRLQLWQQIYQQAGALVAIDASQEIVGFITGGAQHTAALQPTAPGEIYAIYLDPRQQKHGVGRLLWQAKLQQLRQQQLLPLTVTCLATNRQALGFYHHLGGVDFKNGSYQTAGQNFATKILIFREKKAGPKVHSVLK
ncbi:GNAT family N-acetyltransferase [Lapidilactobacillus wuchangensis]|uniref:GNAT family N-acetyltransferase n=1 Tax=Lapidilactobacillus wuchangensis TaxID=2486001 RepID=UPI0013DDF964|nr:GNAT family N-acetyltransferase [Lapidilactobacillus wuchangensis]